MSQKVQIKRTITADQPPTGLLPGELACEMNNPLRLWIGVPTNLDPLGRKLLAPSSGASVLISDNPPPSSSPGTLWWESDSGILWLWYEDVDGAQWVQAAGNTGGGGGGTPIDAYTKAEIDAAEAAQDAKNLTDFVNVTGDTMTGDLKMQSADVEITDGALNISRSVGAIATEVNLNGTALGPRSLVGLNANLRQWVLNLGTGDIANNLAVGRYNDAGAFVDTVFTILRDDGRIVISNLTDTPMLVINRPIGGVGNPSFLFMVNDDEASRLTHNGTAFYIFSNPALNAGVYLPTGTSAWTGISDARLEHKKSATPVSDILSRIDDVQLYTNTNPATGKPELFVKAQELHQSFPELVVAGSGPEASNQAYVPQTGGDTNLWGVTYDRAGVVALQAIKELKAQNDALTARVAALEGVR